MRAAGADGAAQPIVVSMVRVIKLAADGDGDDGDGGGGAGSVDPRTIGLIFVLTVLAVALAAGVVALLRHKHTRFGVSRPGTPSPARARSQQAGHEVMMPTRSGSDARRRAAVAGATAEPVLRAAVAGGDTESVLRCAARDVEAGIWTRVSASATASGRISISIYSSTQ